MKYFLLGMAYFITKFLFLNIKHQINTAIDSTFGA